MKAVVLAAGRGSRMMSLTETRPKGMLPVANKPLLEWLILNARKAGIREFLIVVGYKKGVVKNYFGDGSNFGVKIDYVVQDKQLGTGHALSFAEEFVDNDFIVFPQDVFLTQKDFEKIISVNNSVAVAKKGRDFVTKGQVVLKEGNLVDKILEKTEGNFSDFINKGVYHFDTDIFNYLKKINKSKRGEYELTDAINLLAKDKEVKTVFLDNHLELSYPWDLLELSKKLLEEGVEKEVKGVVEEGVVIKGKVIIGEGTVVKKGSYIEGPVLIGKNCNIGPNSYIRPSTSIGDNCHIGAASEIKNSIIMNNSNAPHHNYVGDSVIGEHCNLGSGTKIANLRFDNKEVKVSYEGKEFFSNKRKLGAFLGDGVETGINSCLLPGTILKPNSRVYPGEIRSNKGSVK